jgi:hypothetical protein
VVHLTPNPLSTYLCLPKVASPQFPSMFCMTSFLIFVPILAISLLVHCSETSWGVCFCSILKQVKTILFCYLLIYLPRYLSFITMDMFLN